jgi:predicted metal-dependent phosphotriesterase family hydrolase
MSPVRTVLGDIESHRLGFTHCHEHLFVFPIRGVKLPEKLIMDDYAKTSRELLAFRRFGGSTLVDAQPFGAGRHAGLLARASRETGVTLIGSTGLHRTLYYPEGFWACRAPAERLAELFVGEIMEGMYAYHPENSTGSRTAFRAGIIKIATGAEGLSEPYRRLFEAAAEAHRQTGAPIMTHTEMSSWGREQALLLMERGVAPSAVIVSHMDRVVDLDRNLGLADLGVFLEYDTIGRFRYHSDEQEAELIRRMIEAGFADRILLGTDATRERLPAYGGRYGYSYLAGSFLPLLRSRGVEEADIQRMVVGNPGRALSLKGRQS